MGDPFFSIIIPTFNQDNYLKETLNSIKSQTFKNFEIIVVDNYSNDNTEQVIKNCSLKINYNKLKNSGIIGKSRNFGLKVSKGKWVCFLDSDDIWSAEKLEVTYKKISEDQFDVICNSEWIKYDQKKIEKLWCYGPLSEANSYKEMLFHGNLLATSATSINKKFLLENNLNFSEKKDFVTCEDYDLFLNIAKLKGKFYFINKPLGTRLIHGSSYSSKKDILNQSSLNVLNDHISKMKRFDSEIGKKIIFYYRTKEDIISILNERNFFILIYFILKKFINSPLIVLRIVKRLVFRYISQRFFYFMHKNK